MRIGAAGQPVRRRFLCSYQYFYPPGPDSCVVSGLAVAPDGRDMALTMSSQSGWALHGLAFGGPELWRVPLPSVLRPGDQQAGYSNPRWTPDGGRLLVQHGSWDGLPGTLLLFDLDGAFLGQAVEGLGRDPDWSARGEIAFLRGSDDPRIRGDLYVARPGGVARRLTWHGAADPSWSPDGRRIAFTRRCPQVHLLLDDDDCVYVIAADGGKPRLLTHAQSTEPVWSPDGKRIAFARLNTFHTIVLRDGHVRQLGPALPPSLDGPIEVARLDWLTRR
jgi:hypothetical protein